MTTRDIIDDEFGLQRTQTTPRSRTMSSFPSDDTHSAMTPNVSGMTRQEPARQQCRTVNHAPASHRLDP